MPNQGNSSQPYGSSSQESPTFRRQPGPSPELMDYFLSGQEAHTAQEAKFSEIVVGQMLAPLTALWEPPYNLSRSDVIPVVFSWVSAMVIEKLTTAGNITDPANKALTEDLQKWESACPEATRLFEELIYEYGSRTSAKGDACKTGEHIWKRDAFRGETRPYRRFHRDGLRTHDLPILGEQYIRVVEGLKAVRQSRRPPQSGQRTQSTFAPKSHQSTMPQSMSNGPDFNLTFNMNPPLSQNTAASGYIVPLETIMPGSQYGGDSQQAQDWFPTDSDTQAPQLFDGNNLQGSSLPSLQPQGPWSYPGDWQNQYPTQ